MASPEKKSKLPLFAIITLLSFAFIALYYVSTDTYKQQSEARLKRVEEIQKTKKAVIYNDQIVLKKDIRQDIGRTSLIYKGIEDGTITIDLYLLDLDPKQGYFKQFKKKKAKEQFNLGNITYRLISANDSYLTLKILARSKTP